MFVELHYIIYIIPTKIFTLGSVFISPKIFTLGSVYISVRHAFPASGGKPRVQNGDSDSYMDAVFEFLAQKEAEIWSSLFRRFIKEGLLQLPG